jgi:anion-transporting  ArsA/GET3 family ATPase
MDARTPRMGSPTASHTASIDGLLSRRVHFVVGKGGVGKSTVSVALALMAVRHGRRPLLIEMEPGGRAASFLGLSEPLGYAAHASPAGVWGIAVDGRSSLEEYLGLILPARRVLKAVLHSKVYQYFVAAAPGLKELMAVGKVWYEAEGRLDGGQRRWDVIVVDAPATGHSLQYLRMPRAARDTFGPGLVRREAARVQALLENPRETAVHLVATAEEIPVAETIEAFSALTCDLRLPTGLLVVNRLHRTVAAEGLVARLREGAAALGPADALVALEVARRAAEENAWAAINRVQLARLQAAVPLPTIVLPMVFAREFGARDVAGLSGLLEEQWAARAGAAASRVGTGA